MTHVIRLMLLLLATHSASAENTLEQRIDSYIDAYVETSNFLGTILVARDGAVLLNKGYGEASIEHSVPNRSNTVFHIASASKPFTAAAIMLLAERDEVDLYQPVSDLLPDFPHGDRITLHHLLAHTSGIPNINQFDEYSELERSEQTAESLYAVYRDRPLLFPPGERYDYSNSNYNLLALIIERVSGLQFGGFLQRKIFGPSGMLRTSHHSDASSIVPHRATGYVPAGHSDLRRARWLDWTVKTGNGSLISTTADLHRWVRTFFGDKVLDKSSRELMLTEHTPNVGYGWFTVPRHGRRQYHINGRSPGFSSYVGYYPDDQLTVVVLTNVYNSITTTVGSDVAAIYFDIATAAPTLSLEPLSERQVSGMSGLFRFGSDFYNPNAEVMVEIRDGHAYLVWNGGPFESALVSTGLDRFVDRMFWSDVEFIRDHEGTVAELRFDQFSGRRSD